MSLLASRQTAAPWPLGLQRSMTACRPLALCSARLTCWGRGSLQLQCRVATPLKRLQRAKIFWDLDNLNARDHEHALVLGSRLRRSVQRATGLPPAAVDLAAFANELTIQAMMRRSGGHAEPWQAVLDMLGAQLVTVGPGKDAADLRMRHEMLHFAAQHRGGAAIAVVSNDQGFAPALARCSKLGAYTVAVGAYLRSAGFNWSAAPLELPVPQAANAIVAFHPGRAATKSGAEQRLARRWQRLSGARPVWPDRALKGVCLRRWDNPGRPFPPQPQGQLEARARAQPLLLDAAAESLSQ